MYREREKTTSNELSVFGDTLHAQFRRNQDGSIEEFQFKPPVQMFIDLAFKTRFAEILYMLHHTYCSHTVAHKPRTRTLAHISRCKCISIVISTHISLELVELCNSIAFTASKRNGKSCGLGEMECIQAKRK